MPCFGEKKTKEQLEEEQYQKGLLKVFEKDQIYLDSNGNLRYGEKKFDPEYELSVIVDKDDSVEEEGKIWYVISTGWMNSWLLYCHLNRGVNPNPGRIDNESLLNPNEECTAWVPKQGLEMARSKREGDYRRISEAAWKSLCDFYPGSGPAIKMEFIRDENHEQDGLYDCSCWQIDQSLYEALVGSKVQKKKSLFPAFKKKEKQDKDKKVDETNEAQDTSTGVEMGVKLTDGKKNDSSMRDFFGKSSMKVVEEKKDNESSRETSSWLFED